MSLKAKDLLKSLLLGLFVIIGTFPENRWTYSIGSDPSLVWVFNHLFENGMDVGKQIVFPHGPLAFFMYPLPQNILIVTLVTSFLKALLVFNVLGLFSDSKNQAKWLASFVFAFVISIIAGFNHLILANIILLYCNSYLSGKKAHKYVAFLLTAFAFYVKAYVAVISGVLFLSFQLWCLFTNKKIKPVLIDAILLLGLIVIFWIAMYGSLEYLPQYLWGMIHLAQDNSSATAYYPYNNWFVLTLFFIAMLGLVMVNRSKTSLFYWILIAFSLFAAWKHGMAREDIYHVKGFFIYAMICLFAFIILSKKNRYENTVLSIAALFLLSVNMVHAYGYSSPKYEIVRVNNFLEFVTDYSALKQKSNDISIKNIASNTLNQKMRDAVSNSKVDIYPWEYSIAAINDLNWQPRVVIQSYASYTSWLDQRNANHFNSKSAPEYLIWESNKTSKDCNGGDLNSIDNRYLLNDEPRTILALLTNYDLYDSDTKFHLYKKRLKPLSSITKPIKVTNSTWGEWIDVPETDNQLLRAKLKFGKSLVQGLKSFFYKDEQFWVYLKLRGGTIHKYRIVPKNAADGLWINPYIYHFDKAYTVDSVMFKCSNQSILKKNLTVEWEQIGFEANPNRIQDFFGINVWNTDTLLLNSMNGYEQVSMKNWDGLSKELILKSAFEGNYAYLIKANSFSNAFILQLDSIPFQDLKITADCWIKSPDYKFSNNILMIISVTDETGSILWNALQIDGQLIDNKQWNHILSFIHYKHNTANRSLQVYFWNKSTKDAMIDNFTVSIQKNNNP